MRRSLSAHLLAVGGLFENESHLYGARPQTAKRFGILMSRTGKEKFLLRAAVCVMKSESRLRDSGPGWGSPVPWLAGSILSVNGGGD